MKIRTITIEGGYSDITFNSENDLIKLIKETIKENNIKIENCISALFLPQKLEIKEVIDK